MPIHKAALENIRVRVDTNPHGRRAESELAENGLTHLIVIHPPTGHPSGILSSLDVAAAYAD